mgnify:CR=1 FL=1
MIELSAPRRPASIATLAALLLHDAQSRSETAAWLTSRRRFAHPADVACAGVDMNAVPVVVLSTAPKLVRAAERLVRSGAFGLIVIDLVGARSCDRIPTALLNRISALTRTHEATVLFLTEKDDDAPCISPLVSLRASASRRVASSADVPSMVCVDVLRDRDRPGLWRDTLPCATPASEEDAHGPPPPEGCL